jgi:4-amino-4-deoxy-L-arabinose transferase-like glycosyltransferase
MPALQAPIDRELTRRRFIAIALLILIAGTTLRTLWLRADPPTTAVGVVWHDEGAWVHNARNRALWGEWRSDAWNPVFIAPVFTAFEYAAFTVFGVGTWQARTVPVASGLAVIVLLMAGLNQLGGRRIALLGGALVATNYVFVMWNRAALMESTMTAFIVASWAAYAHAEQKPVWGLAAGLAAVLAWFTKAAAAFFLAALAIDVLIAIFLRRRDQRSVRAAWMTAAGLAATALAIGVWFVLPHWNEYHFYNIEMSVLRKPSYGVRDFMDRASWIPLVHDLFTRMWLVVVGAVIGLIGIAARWRTARAGERLLVLWLLIGLAELVVHDAGNERRYVMFIPALIALASLFAGSAGQWLSTSLASLPPARRWLALPLVAFLAYLVVGSVVRLAFQSDLDLNVGNFKPAVRVSAALAFLLAAAVLWRLPATARLLPRVRVPGPLLAGLVVVSLGWNLLEYGQWARRHDEMNYRASVELGRILPPGTLVHGKLANGLSLENRIRPLFVGRGFGNYEDRLRRDDARYILTYVLPKLGYESQAGLIQEILDRYPRWGIVQTFDVDETTGVDRAELIDKFSHARD